MAVSQVSLAELRKHDSKEDCWIAVHAKVWDFTEFVDEHPGGAESEPSILTSHGTEANSHSSFAMRWD